MTRRHWWDDPSAVDDEAAWLSDAAQDFLLDDELFASDRVVVFRGHLRLGIRRVAASVVFPPSYGDGGHPVVVAPELPVGRHSTPSGMLCLDHPVLGEMAPMSGAEAVARAQHLWDLWENDREQLEAEEADAPDPASNYFDTVTGSAVVMGDLDLGEATRGYFRLKAHKLDEPLRGVITSLRVTHPQACELVPEPSLSALEGSHVLNGAWKRVDRPPPFTVPKLASWLQEHHRVWFDAQLDHARQRSKAERTDIPAVFAFVYPNEGSGRAEVHDAWLFCLAWPETGKGYLARSFPLPTAERWLRQPQLRPLEERRVTIVGVGALGSQVADMAAKAGIGHLTVIDYDILMPGNRVRHQLDLRDVGRAKVWALEERLQAVNPWCKVETVKCNLGGPGLGAEERSGQQVDDMLFEKVASSDLLINASAHSPTGRHLSEMAVDGNTTAIHTWVSAGAWGCRVLVQRPKVSACWQCLALAQKEPEAYAETVVVPAVAADPDVSEISERGCADPTFTGPGFELAHAAASTARIASQVLLDGEGYPPVTFDLATLQFRDTSTGESGAQYTMLPPHPHCNICSGP